LFADVPTGNRQQRNKRILDSHITHGYTLKEIADNLGIHYTTIGKVVAGRMKK
jgi:transposase